MGARKVKNFRLIRRKWSGGPLPLQNVGVLHRYDSGKRTDVLSVFLL